MQQQRFRRQAFFRAFLLVGLLCSTLLARGSARSEGSGTLFPALSTSHRANIEWRSSTYGPNILRRTLFKTYLNAGEFLLVGSSAVGVQGTPNKGDILVYDPGLVTGTVGQELLPGTPSFSCADERAASGNAAMGRIGSRAQELAGPNTSDNQVPGGYTPCVFQAQTSGIHDVVFLGPAGAGVDTQSLPSGQLNPPPSAFGPDQNTSITAWDLTVRASLDSTAPLKGRTFAYYLAMFTGGNGRQVIGAAYIATKTGFIYRADYRGDPNGFVIYANQLGFLNNDGTPLYGDVMADPTDNSFYDQNQLSVLQGGTSLQPPEYPLFFDKPDSQTLQALGIPQAPDRPVVSDLRFVGSEGEGVTLEGKGGTFSFTSNQAGVYSIIISRDGVNFDPNNEQNRVLRGVLGGPGLVEANWNGLDNSGQPFPIGKNYKAETSVQAGEVHFPFLDVENNVTGGPTIELINPPGGECPPWNGGCYGAFYDDRGYTTSNGSLVGTAVNGPLCPGDVGVPPAVIASDPRLGYDSQQPQRAFGFPTGGNPPNICDPLGGFGDKKGLDLWSFYPSNLLLVPLVILDAKAVDLQQFTVSRESAGVVAGWVTGAEINTWGFHLLRSATGRRADAAQVTAAPILARGRGGGATYAWLDRSAVAGQRYSYWLQEIETGGAIHEYGPAVLLTEPADVAYTVALPLLQR